MHQIREIKYPMKTISGEKQRKPTPQLPRRTRHTTRYLLFGEIKTEEFRRVKTI